MGMHYNQIRKYADALERDGYLRRTPRKGKPYIFDLKPLCEKLEARRPAFAKLRQDLTGVRLPVTALLDPALGVDGGELLPPIQDHAQPGAEVLGLLVTQVAEDLHGRRKIGAGRPAFRDRDEPLDRGP